LRNFEWRSRAWVLGYENRETRIRLPSFRVASKVLALMDRALGKHFLASVSRAAGPPIKNRFNNMA